MVLVLLMTLGEIKGCCSWAPPSCEDCRPTGSPWALEESEGIAGLALTDATRGVACCERALMLPGSGGEEDG